MSAAPFHRPESSAQCIIRVLRYAWPYRFWILTAVVCAVAGSLTDVAQVAMFKQIVDMTVQGTQWTQMAWNGLMLLGLVVLAILADAAHGYGMSVTSQRIALDMQNEVHTHLHTLDDDFFLQHPPDELAQRTFQDTASVQQMVGLLSGTLVRHPLTFLCVGGGVCALTRSGICAGLARHHRPAYTHRSRLHAEFAAHRKKAGENRASVLDEFLALLDARSLLRFYDPTGRYRARVQNVNESFHALAISYLRRKCAIAPLRHLVSTTLADLIISLHSGGVSESGILVGLLASQPSVNLKKAMS